MNENELKIIAEYAKLRHLSFAGHLSEFIDPPVEFGSYKKSPLLTRQFIFSGKIYMVLYLRKTRRTDIAE